MTRAESVTVTASDCFLQCRRKKHMRCLRGHFVLTGPDIAPSNSRRAVKRAIGVPSIRASTKSIPSPPR
jgi:hypothetical protein